MKSEIERRRHRRAAKMLGPASDECKRVSRLSATRKFLASRQCLSVVAYHGLLALCYADAAWHWRVYSGMVRRCACIALAVMLVGLSTAHAADTTLTLACQGATTAGTEYKPEPVSMGIIVNFTKKTVHGFVDPLFGEPPIKITSITETAVLFGLDDKLQQNMSRSVMGAIDRVTDNVWADFTSSDTKTGKTITSKSYALKCKLTQGIL